MHTQAIHALKTYVPPDWTWEVVGVTGVSEHVLIKSDDGYMVTVDFHARGCRLGLVVHGRMLSDEVYAGRGWYARLVRDAVTFLRDLDRPTKRRG